MSICYPDGTDWSCKFDADTLAEKRADEVEAAKLERSEAFAWSTLAALTAYRIGTCPVTVRPCAARCLPRGGFLSAPVRSSGSWLPLSRIGGPYISGGNWYNACSCTREGDCGCEVLSEVVLPGPVGAIVSVVLNGETLPRSAYRVDNTNRLVRLDGGVWPACQDMSLNEGDDTFAVTYYRGTAPNLLTRAAAGALAAEFYEACGGNSCRLPWNITAAARQGESYEMEAGVEGIADAIPEVAAVVNIYNPYGLKSQPFVASPDSYGTRTPTWT